MRKQSFGQVANSYVRVFNEEGGTSIRYDLGEDFSIETSNLLLQNCIRNGAEWKFNAIGSGFKGGFKGILY